MQFYSNPIYVLIMLSLMVILSVYAGKSKIGTKLGGPALLVIIFTAIIANFKLIPSASNSIDLYDVIFKYVAPISIFYLLLNINKLHISKLTCKPCLADHLLAGADLYSRSRFQTT